MKCACSLLSCLVFVCVLPANMAAQEPATAKENGIALARDFLRTLYPGLNGKNYIITLETYLPYDHPADKISFLRMDVGEGAKDWLIGYFGCLSNPPIPEGATPVTPVSPAQQPEGQVTAEPCKPGPKYPKQLLTAGFQFDHEGHLTSFGADGPLIDDRKGDTEVYEIVHAHPEMTYAQVVATMKQHGTKYGPDDKEQFVKDMPWKQLEPFLGNLRIMSVSCPQMDKEPNPVPWVDRWLSPDWTVKAQATKDGTKVPYELRFSHLNGYLTGLLDCRTSPWCNRD